MRSTLCSVLAASFLSTSSLAATEPPRCEVKVSFAKAGRSEPLSGRLLVAFARKAEPEPLRQTGSTGVPLFGIDVVDLAPDTFVALDSTAFGHPIVSLAGLPAGKYQVQACFHLYSRFTRADGKTVLLPPDRGEGQNWLRAPGNLISLPTAVEIDPAKGFSIEIVCERARPKIDFPADTDFVKSLRIRSVLLSKFWGQDVEIGANVLLPRDYAEHPERRYPVLYSQGHYSLGPPGGFGRGRDFDRFWLADDTPRFLLVTFQHPTPFYDDSYAVNSANNGPYGDALVSELIPEVERRFHAIGQPWARTLTGGSTGGWECLALQIFYPELFNGCWSLCPDSLDFRSHQIVDIYSDSNAYFAEHEFTTVERPCRRRVDGSIEEMMKDENRFELAVGDRSRSGGQWDGWEAAFSPIGDDGYPRRLWDKFTGAIDPTVAAYWREHYDLRHILESRWSELGPKLVGKLHVYVGEDDDYYLENGVKHFERFLRSTTAPAYGGSVTYGSEQGHCFGPSLNTLLPEMARWIASTAPSGADVESWHPGAAGR